MLLHHRLHGIVLVTALATPLVSGAELYASEMEPHIQFNLGFNTRNPSDNLRYTTWVPSISLLADLNRHWVLTADWGLTLIDTDDLNGTRADALNPYLAVHFRSRFRKGSFRVGGGVTLPVADGEGLGRPALEIASAMRGNWNPWLYTSDTMSLIVPLRAEFYPSTKLTLAADLAAFMLFPFIQDDTQIGIQGAAEGIFHLRRADLGLRIQGVRTEDDNPTTTDTQASLEPYVAVHLGDLSIRTKLTVNLSQPEGFAFDGDGIWGLHIGGIYHF